MSRNQIGGSADAFDCFNGDLLWILGKLIDRAGGDGGLLSGHVGRESAATILARSTPGQRVPEFVWAELAERGAAALDGSPRGGDDDVRIVRARFATRFSDGDEREVRCLHLLFAPASNVGVVATVCKVGAVLPFGPLQQATAARLYPVLSRYVRLWWMHRAERRRANSLSAALDLPDVGILLLDRRGEAVFANGRAEALMKRKDGLRRHENSIVAAHEQETTGLHAAIRHAIRLNQFPAEKIRGAAPPSVLPVQRQDGRRPLIVTVMSVARLAVDEADPAVIIYVLDPEQNVEELLAPVCRLYELTATETRLVFRLVAGERLADAARQMSIQLDTARTYLKQVFAKTRTNRQVDLVRVMLASAMRTSAGCDF